MHILKLFTVIIAFLSTSSSFAQEYNQTTNCQITSEIREKILSQVKDRNPNAIKNLPNCFKFDRKLIFTATLIDVSQFQYAAQILREDENFVNRLLKVNPIVLKFASPKLRSDQNFMEHATYLNRDALQYADPSLLDNKIFMTKMIIIDSRNYIFASRRLKNNHELAEIAFEDNGILLANAPEEIRSNFKLAKIALKSNSNAIAYVSDNLKKNKTLKKLANNKDSLKNLKTEEELAEFLEENYVIKEKRKNIGSIIGNRAKFFDDNKIVQRNYVTKWQKHLNYENYPYITESLNLISVDSRNYPISWKDDFANYPLLIKKIEKFFLKHNVSQNTIDNLSTTYLWRVKDDPMTLAFNIYLLSESDDADLGPNFADVTSLTAIVKKEKNRWEMTVIEVVFSSEVRVNIAYENGRKDYVLWDLYKVNKDDKNPKIIFKVNDRFEQYFEIFEEQNGGKYNMIYSITPDLGNKPHYLE